MKLILFPPNRLLEADPAEFLDAAIGRQGFPEDGQMRALLRRHIPIPESVFSTGFLEVAFGGDEELYAAAMEEGWIDRRSEVGFYNDLRAYQPVVKTVFRVRRGPR